MYVSDGAKASFMRDLADLLDRHPWAAFAYRVNDDGVYVDDQTSRDSWCIGFPGNQADMARAVARQLSEKSAR